MPCGCASTVNQANNGTPGGAGGAGGSGGGFGSGGNGGNGKGMLGGLSQFLCPTCLTFWLILFGFVFLVASAAKNRN